MDYKILILSLTFYLLGVISFKYNIFPIDQIKSAVSSMKKTESSLDAYRNLSSDTYYFHRKSFLENLTEPSKIVMIGDSLTDIADWNKMFPEIKISNQGISGDITEGILNRVETICKTNAKQGFLLIGINDIQRQISVNDIFSNYQKIIENIKKCGIEPIVQSTLQVSKLKDRLNTDINALNEKLKVYCQENKITYIDLNSQFSTDGKLQDKFTRDGIHLNGLGYKTWQNILKDYIK